MDVSKVTLSLIIVLLTSFSPTLAETLGDDAFCSRIEKFKKQHNKLQPGFLRQTYAIGIAECYLLDRSTEKNIETAVQYLETPAAEGNRTAQHMLASLRLFHASNAVIQQLGFEQLQREFEDGSAYAAGKLGHAYLDGIYVKQDTDKALDLFHHAATNGMTYWQFLLAHAYEQGYFGLSCDIEKSKYWLNFQPKVHHGRYECWVSKYYRDGTFPENNALKVQYSKLCKQQPTKP